MNKTAENIIMDYVDQRIEVKGMFGKLSTVYRNDKSVRTALLQEACVVIDDKEYDIGHTWLQNADEFVSCKTSVGMAIRCTVRVNKRKKYLEFPNEQGLSLEIVPSLSYPKDIVVLSSQQPISDAQSSSHHVPKMQPVNVAQLIGEVRRLADVAGGLDALEELIRVLR